MSVIQLEREIRPDVLHPIAEMYVYRALDFVVEHALVVSYDYVERPQHYQIVPEQVGHMLADLRTLTGHDPAWPDVVQRAHLSGGLSRMGVSLASLRRAAIAFTDCEAGRERAIQRRALLKEAVILRSALQELDGKVVPVRSQQLETIFAVAVDILSSTEVSRAFGLPPISPEAWRWGGDAGQDAAQLCKEITNRAGGRLPNKMSLQKFTMLQRVAHFGALTISNILDGTFTSDEDEHVTALAQHAHSWTIALQSLLSNIDLIRAWKSPEYRRSLEIIELDLLPSNPAGDIDLSGARLDTPTALIQQTYTANGEICCSTGDFYCG